MNGVDLERLENMYVGDLTATELVAFISAIKSGQAYRKYDNWAQQMLGIAKVGIIRNVTKRHKAQYGDWEC
jgi:hypothetical protein